MDRKVIHEKSDLNFMNIHLVHYVGKYAASLQLALIEISSSVHNFSSITTMSSIKRA